MSLEDMLAKKAKEAVEAKFGVDPDEYLGKVGLNTDTVIEKAGGVLGLGSFLGGHTATPEHAAEHHAEPASDRTEDTDGSAEADTEEEYNDQQETDREETDREENDEQEEARSDTDEETDER